VTRRKEAVKTLFTLTEERAPGTRYDRYFIEEFAKKIKETAGIDEITQRLKAFEGAEFVTEVERIVEQHQSKHD
jgi:hypothetical protein